MIEIDGVRSRLHDFVSEAGDYISDEYLRLIDVTTSPEPVTDINNARLTRIIKRLNMNLATTSVYLSETPAAQAYDDTIRQVNDINSERNVPQLSPLMDGATSALPAFSATFNWGVR